MIRPFNLKSLSTIGSFSFLAFARIAFASSRVIPSGAVISPSHAYAVGLFIGIVIFYDHFAGQKLSKAPTPLEVEMDKYDKDVLESVIDREGGK